MSPELFKAFQTLIYSSAGISLREGKEVLLEARIAKRVRSLGLTGPEEYLRRLRGDGTGVELTHFLDAVSTNYTSFFREKSHFDDLSALVARRVREGAKSLKLWCAASSSGEEPYTIAITLAEALRGTDVTWKLLATDISTRVLALAKRATYPEAAIEAVPPALRARYFEASVGGERQVVTALRERITFGRLNLARPPYPMRGPLDAVLCRNVMIYFDEPVRQGFVAEAERLLMARGLLVVGHSETLNGLDTSLRPLKPSVYVKAEAS